MKAKWNEKCWNCGSPHMVDQGDFARCEDCGATATPIIKVNPFDLESHYMYRDEGEGLKRVRSLSPKV